MTGDAVTGGDAATGGDPRPAPQTWPPLRRTSCDLCEAAQITPWHHEDEICWVADCEICEVPMVVWREHGAHPPEDALAHMLEQLGRIADARFGPGGWSVDRVMRQIPDHFHAHGRDPDWWYRRFGG